MTYIDGWAFKKNEKELSEERRQRYEQIKHLRNEMIRSVSPQYGRTIYKGILKPEWKLSDLDILLVCDRGNTCFGGTVERTTDSFKAEVYVD